MNQRYDTIILHHLVNVPVERYSKINYQLSFMKIQNNTGPKIESCRTPEATICEVK